MLFCNNKLAPVKRSTILKRQKTKNNDIPNESTIKKYD